MAKKNGPLSIVDKYAVQGMVAEDKTIEEISNQIGRTEISVEKYIESWKNSIAKINAGVAPVTPQKKTAHDLMITETSGKKISGVIVATKESSELGDEHRKSHTPKVGRTARGNVWNIKEGKLAE